MAKAGQFIEWIQEKSGIVSTALAQTASLDDPQIITDMRNHAFDFGELKRVGTADHGLSDPANRDDGSSRQMVTADDNSALNAVIRPRAPGEPRVLFMLDEFAALGHLEIVSTVWALVRGNGVQILPVLQNLTQFKQLYGEMARKLSWRRRA